MQFELGKGQTEGRINRYIMECKFPVTAAETGIIAELIDTLWNVNLIPPDFRRRKEQN